MNFLDPRLPDRFWNKVAPCPMSGCWLWIGSISSTGYGNLTVERKVRNAHRLCYETLVGPVARPLQLDHRCRVRSCVNPAHLEPVTSLVNTLRGIGPTLSKARQAAVTHCPHGHEYSEANTYRTVYAGRNHRQCKTCRFHDCRRRRAEKRAAK